MRAPPSGRYGTLSASAGQCVLAFSRWRQKRTRGSTTLRVPPNGCRLNRHRRRGEPAAGGPSGGSGIPSRLHGSSRRTPDPRSRRIRRFGGTPSAGPRRRRVDGILRTARVRAGRRPARRPARRARRARAPASASVAPASSAASSPAAYASPAPGDVDDLGGRPPARGRAPPAVASTDPAAPERDDDERVRRRRARARPRRASRCPVSSCASSSPAISRSTPAVIRRKRSGPIARRCPAEPGATEVVRPASAARTKSACQAASRSGSGEHVPGDVQHLVARRAGRRSRRPARSPRWRRDRSASPGTRPGRAPRSCPSAGRSASGAARRRAP